jgi:hypothetical protein
MISEVYKERSFRLLMISLYGLSSFLFLFIAYNSFGYDDEYWNIRMIEENSLYTLIYKIQSSDVHPPLSYILNFILFKIFEDWQFVRLFSACIFLAALAVTILKTKAKEAQLLLILFLGLNPTIMIWATSIRWYAYAIPLLMMLSFPNNANSKYFWYYFFFGFLILSFLSYVGIILIIPYFFWYFFSIKGSISKKIKQVIVPASIFLLAYAHQFYTFITVHRANNIQENQQTFDVLTSIKSFVSSVFSNQAIFPLSTYGLLSILGYLVIFVLFIYSVFKHNGPKKGVIPFLVGSILFILTGLAGKLRNLVLLDISKAHFISGIHKKGLKFPFLTALILIFSGNVFGIYNVLTHQRTTKNAWNLPFSESLSLMQGLEKSNCQEVYFTFHPTYTYHLLNQEKKLISFYSGLYFDSTRIKTSVMQLDSIIKTNSTNFNFLLTYRGRSIEQSHYQEMLRQMKLVQADSIKIFKLGFDGDYALKQSIYPDYPFFTFYLYKFYGVKGNILGLKVWERNQL